MSQLDGSVFRHHISGKDVRFFVSDSADEIQRHHAQGVFYEREELDLITKFWNSERAFVDIGANIGNHCIFASLFLSTPKIVVFEPNPKAIELLRINLLLNRCDNVDTRFLGIALGAEEQNGNVTPDPLWPHNLGGTTIQPDPFGKTRVVPGDEILRCDGVGFIKIDTEGMELDVLSGLQRTISTWKPHIFVEVIRSKREAFLAKIASMAYHVAATITRYEGMDNYIILPS
jgi:FkbM family methyltransferase